MRSRRGSTVTRRCGTPPRSPAPSQPPQASVSYDHDTPTPGFVYCTPRGPHLFQPDDWRDRVLDAPAIVFDSTADRAETVQNLLDGPQEHGETGPLFDAPDDVVRPFGGLGFGYLVLDNLFEAADHERLLDAAGFWADVTAAVEAVSTERPRVSATHLKAAAEKLLAGPRADPLAAHALARLRAARSRRTSRRVAGVARGGLPVCIAASGETFERLAAEQRPERFAELRSRFLPDPADRRRSVLRVVPRPRGRAHAARVAVVESPRGPRIDRRSCFGVEPPSTRERRARSTRNCPAGCTTWGSSTRC